MKTFQGTLPDTDTYKDRSWELILPDAPGEQEDAALTIEQRRGRKVERDTYQLQVERADRPLVVQLLNVTDPTQEDVYEVAVGLSVRNCTCKGFWKPKWCKHLAATVAAMEKGAFAFISAAVQRAGRAAG